MKTDLITHLLVATGLVATFGFILNFMKPNNTITGVTQDPKFDIRLHDLAKAKDKELFKDVPKEAVKDIREQMLEEALEETPLGEPVVKGVGIMDHGRNTPSRDYYILPSTFKIKKTYAEHMEDIYDYKNI